MSWKSIKATTFKSFLRKIQITIGKLIISKKYIFKYL